MLSRLFLLSMALAALPVLGSASPFPVSYPVLEQRQVAPPQFPNAERLSTTTIRIPFKLAGHLILVQAEVAGQSGNFILDTGSSKLILNASHYSGGQSAPNTVGMSMTGAIKDLREATVRDFTIDSLQYDRLYADVIDLNHIERKKNIRLLGLLGYNVVENYELMIDFQLKQLTLTALDDEGNRIDTLAFYEKPTDSLRVTMDKHFLVINGEVDGKALRLGLDSGAELNLLHNRVNRAILDHFKISRRTHLAGMSGQQELEVIAGKLYRFRSGEQRCSGMRTLLTNMHTFNRTYRTRLDGLIGYEFLCVRRTLINYKKQKLYFFKWYQP
ncbi:retropepsin-like aspartic protease [Phaeodactylibacter sp.]|uniref:retropepsin-like aspartic protease n=1 Tax=Phaeodactylibacter sp. TaxID=1940289 RepID=UPI0025F164AD|nr:retropepsin-like aspartic protease [Phaeodactylibacter sp.]MCI4647502.1 retropepsin-like domain-containing protein [Phaeodactylibacter sp.]MCI5093605.1 retropepsin-like domain-containing protein [Phaeodactylibacter sp.]